MTRFINDYEQTSIRKSEKLNRTDKHILVNISTFIKGSYILEDHV